MMKMKEELEINFSIWLPRL